MKTNLASQLAQEFWFNKMKHTEVEDSFTRTAKSRGPEAPPELAQVDVPFGPGLTAVFTYITKENAAQEFVLGLGTLFTVLYKYNFKSPLVATPAIRDQAQPAGTDGGPNQPLLFFTGKTDGQSTYKKIVESVKEQFKQALRHQHYDFGQFLAAVEANRPGERDAFYNLGFGHDKLTDTAQLTGGTFRLAFTLLTKDQPYRLRLTYDPACYPADFVRQLGKHFLQTLQHYLKHAEEPVARRPALDAGETQAVVYDFNATVAPYSREKTLHALFEAQVARTPGAVALRQDGTEMTYEALNRRANQLARKLRAAGVCNGDNVGLVTSRGFDMIVGMYAILKAGGAYVPIDPAYPVDRQQYILTNSGVSTVLTDADYPVAAAAPGVAFLPTGADTCSSFEDGNLRLEKSSADLAYTIYTSGSTGRPKGVMIEHHSAVNLVEWVNGTFGVGSHDRLLFITSMCFDLSVYDIFGILAAGGSLVIARQEEVQDVEKLTAYLVNEQITFWDSVPTTLNYLVGELESAGNPFAQTQLRLVFLSGDWIPVSLPGRTKKYFPRAEVISLGGATEGTVWSNYYPVTDVPADWTSIPYGKPIANNFFYILDEDLHPVPPGVVGELYIGGVGVARGYANDAEKTACSYVKDPFSSTLGGRMYRTGDLGRMQPDGNMEFLGRKDHQVKIRGYRVELGEIKNVLLAHEGVDEVAVIARKDSAGAPQLVAYVTGPGVLDTAALRTYLRGYLPDYMIPAHLVRLATLPLNANGKIDLKALPDVQSLPAGDAAGYVAPVTELEKQLVAIWQEVLENERIGTTDNFFEIGGHSLKAARVVGRIAKELRIRTELRTLFAYPTVGGLAGQLEKTGRVAYEQITPVAVQPHYEVSHGQKRFWAMDRVEKDQTAYHIPGAYQLEGHVDPAAFGRAFAALVARHESLRTVFVSAAGEPRQVIQPADRSGFRVEYLDLREEEGKDAVLKALTRQEAAQPFDLERGPLLRAKLLHLADTRYVFLFTLHHIIADAWSMGVLLREVLALYDAFSRGEANPLPPLRIQYKDYAAWHNARLGHEAAGAHAQYWEGQLGGEVPAPGLPTDFPRPARSTHEGDHVQLTLDETLTAALRTLSHDNGASLYMTLLASVYTLLHQRTGQSDIVIGAPVAGRDHNDLENQIGLYINTVALRTHLAAGDPFSALVEKVKQTVLGAYEHQLYPFDEVVQRLPGKPGRGPLFEVGVDFATGATVRDLGENASRAGIRVRPVDDGFKGAKASLWFNLSEYDGKIALTLDYSTRLFKEASAERLAADWQWLLAQLAAAPGSTPQQLAARLTDHHAQRQADAQQQLKARNLHSLLAAKAG